MSESPNKKSPTLSDLRIWLGVIVFVGGTIWYYAQLDLKVKANTNTINEEKEFRIKQINIVRTDLQKMLLEAENRHTRSINALQHSIERNGDLLNQMLMNGQSGRSGH